MDILAHTATLPSIPDSDGPMVKLSAFMSCSESHHTLCILNISQVGKPLLNKLLRRRRPTHIGTQPVICLP
jgi:hypothetical protein